MLSNVKLYSLLPYYPTPPPFPGTVSAQIHCRLVPLVMDSAMELVQEMEAWSVVLSITPRCIEHPSHSQ